MANALKVAAWAGVFLVSFSFVVSLLNSILPSNFLASLTSFVILVAGVIFYYGFFILGERYNQGLLKAFSVYFMIITVLSFFLIAFFAVYYMDDLNNFVGDLGDVGLEIEGLEDQYGGEENIPEDVLEEKLDPLFDIMLTFLKFALIIHILVAVFYGIPTIFFGVGLMKLGKSVEYSKAAGILSVIGGATYILFVGYFIEFVSIILQIIILFKESEKKVKRR